ncbi:hypothetical protein TIFTF001_031135 [Ficus carica]|uniref:Uncharacterized protein n=1 Tax=Ficus carica TaxID=3494 RepID=A0AA88J5Y0_FICCA|nr:hypothetical protein TIFTF001_031135 [Ficus carica]
MAGVVVCGTQQLGSTGKMVPKRLGIVNPRVPMVGNSDIYAGFAFAVLSTPSLFPLLQGSPITVDDSATRDLRRVLQIY